MGTKRMQSSLPVPGTVQGRNEWAVFTLQGYRAPNILPNKRISLDWSFCLKIANCSGNPPEDSCQLAEKSHEEVGDLLCILGIFFSKQGDLMAITLLETLCHFNDAELKERKLCQGKKDDEKPTIHQVLALHKGWVSASKCTTGKYLARKPLSEIKGA